MGNELSAQQQALHEFVELTKSKRRRKKKGKSRHWDEVAQSLVEAVPKWEQVRGVDSIHRLGGTGGLSGGGLAALRCLPGVLGAELCVVVQGCEGQQRYVVKCTDKKVRAVEPAADSPLRVFTRVPRDTTTSAGA